MTGTKLQVGATIDVAFGDVLKRFPRDDGLVVWFLITVLVSWASYFLAWPLQTHLIAGALAGRIPGAAPDLRMVQLATALSTLVASAIASAVATPLALAVHRKVLLNESPSWNSLGPLARSRVKAFFMVAFSIGLIKAAASMLPTLASFLLTRPEIVLVLSSLLALTVGTIFGVRVSPAFPAVAVDRPGLWLANGFAISRGHAWRLFWVLLFIALAIGLPMAGIFVAGYLFFGFSMVGLAPGTDPATMLAHTAWSPSFVLMPLVVSVGWALMIAGWASALSHFYRTVAGDPAVPAVA